ncbi:MAG: adenine deaminase [Desulfobacterales bacterium]|jgi:adenine deaminase|nr:adenine deaminase [Desulfobacterales bacterium]
MTKTQFIAAAGGNTPVDLLLTNARIVNVFSGEMLPGNIAIAGCHIVGIGDYAAKQVVDLKGKIVAPGFIDPHLHIESAMVSVSEFARAVLARGTTTVVADPHEIANVLGIAGIRYMLDAAEGQPVNVYYTLPSCVPATELETAGARLAAGDLSPLMAHERILALAEMMNFPGVIHRDSAVLEKIEIAETHGKKVDGHAPGLSGKALNAYIGAGIASDHECTSALEARDKLRAGMHIMIREGTGAKNLFDILPLVNAGDCHRMMWCTDDRHPQDLLEKGHVDDLIRRAIQAGLDPVTAIRMGTLNPAEYFGLSHSGAIGPGRRADLVVLSDLSNLKIESVYSGGILSVENGYVLPGILFPTLPPPPPAMNVGISKPDFSIPLAGTDIRVIQIIPDQIVTTAAFVPVSVKENRAVADTRRDLLKIAVVERHKATGNVGVGFVRGMGLKRGAIGASVAHDSHNIILVGENDTDMNTVLARIIEMGGGLAVACEGQILCELPLPVAGLMSGEPLAVVRNKLDELTLAARSLGAVLSDPFMTLSFLALPVIPDLKITDLGLVDVASFKIVPLFQNHPDSAFLPWEIGRNDDQAPCRR